MSQSVLSPYNEGAVAFQQRKFRNAQEKYQAALEEARSVGDKAGIGASLAGLGAVHQALGEYPQASESFSAALPYFTEIKNLAGEGLMLGAIGETHAQMGQYAKAIEYFDRTLVIMEKLLKKTPEKERLAVLRVTGMVLYEKAKVHEELEQFNEAVESFRRAAAEYQLTGDLAKQGMVLWLAGTMSRIKMKAPREAIELLADAWPLLQSGGMVVDATWARAELGSAYMDSRNYEEAIAVFTEVVKAAREQKQSELVTQGYLSLALASERQLHFENALSYYQAALEGVRKSHDPRDRKREALILESKGELHRLLSQYGEAIEDFHTAAIRYRELEDTEREARTLQDLAEVFFWIADYQTAAKYHKQALELYKRTENLSKQVETLAALAQASWLGRRTPHDEISSYLYEGKALLDSVRADLGFDPITPLGKALNKVDEDFLKQSSQLLEKWKQKQPQMSARDLWAFVSLEYSVGESKNVFREWQKMVPSLGEDYLMAAGALNQKTGTFLLFGGKPDDAAGYFRLAHIYHSGVPFNRDVGIELAKDWFYLGEAHRRQGSFDLALLYFHRAKVVASLLRTPEIHWTQVGLARTHADKGDKDLAMAYYSIALEGLESVQRQQGTEELKIGVLEGALYLYRDFVNFILDLYVKTGEKHYIDQAFQYTERLRARVFLDMLGRSKVTRLEGELGWLATKEEETRRQIAEIYRQLRATNLGQEDESRLLKRLEHLREGWRTLQQRAAQQSPRYAQIILPQPVTLEEVQSALNADTVLLEYSITPKSSKLWAITKDEVQVYSLPGSQGLPVLEQYLKTVREPLIESGEVSRHLTLGRELYRRLLEPAEQQIREKKHLILVPDGPLYYLPFEALIVPEGKDGSNGSGTLADVDYLLKKFQVTYVPSASVLVTQRKKHESHAKTGQFPIVAFGDPVYRRADSAEGTEVNPVQVSHKVLRGHSFSRLDFSAQEVRRIARIWDVPLDSEHINLRERATVERVRELDLSRYRILHFATHGVLGDEIGLTTQPALVLSQVGDNAQHGGLLQLADILDLKLNADLVVLSACSTALGRLREGEGIVGLTRAFMYAGASSVVVSLWKVEDQSTSLLMERFYQRLKQGESEAEALRQAKLDVMRSTIELKAIGMPQALASPFYWAPFILVGGGT